MRLIPAATDRIEPQRRSATELPAGNDGGTSTSRGALVSSNSPNHPSKWARVETTLDNATYRIRPICVEDALRERAFIVGLSPESRYTRLMYTMGDPSPDLVNRFVQVDYHHSTAFVAVIGQGEEARIIGVARYAANRDEDYEFAVAIADAWQARGVAGTLSHLLFDYARNEGIRTLHAKILATTIA